MYLELRKLNWLLYLQSVLYHYLHILCMFLRQPLLLLLLRVTLLVILIPTGLMVIVGDQIYLKGIYQKDLVKLETAKFLFPFEREILISPAQFYFREKVLNYIAYKEALRYDPYSVQFLGVIIQLDYLYGNKNEALINKQKLQRIAPNSNVLKRINDMKGLK